MSRVDFHDDKISLEMDRINSTINKLDELAKNIKQKEKSSNKIPELMRTIQ
jgi:flagellar hook-associated protein FlgK